MHCWLCNSCTHSKTVTMTVSEVFFFKETDSNQLNVILLNLIRGNIYTRMFVAEN